MPSKFFYVSITYLDKDKERDNITVIQKYHLELDREMNDRIDR